MPGIKNSILDTIGDTPIVRINNIGPKNVELFVKVEAFNPLGSVKDRMALATVEAAERLIALFLYQGEYRAINDLCPHAGASLGAGCIDDGDPEREGVAKAPTVVCPLHGWRFRLTDGKWADNPRLGVDVFETRVTGDEIQVLIPDES